MKRFPVPYAMIACLAILVSVIVMALPGCANLPVQSPAQVAAQICPPTQAVLAGVAAVALEPKLAFEVGAVDVAVNLVCKDVASVKAVDLQSLSVKAIPDLISIVKSAPIPADIQDRAILDLTVAQVALTAFVAAQPIPPVIAPAASAASGV